MSDYGFTAGPWSVQWNGHRDWTDGEVKKGDAVIAIVCGTNQGQFRDAEDEGNAEFAANARLIAASPTLLEAVIAAEDYFTTLPADDAARSLYLQMNATIQLATGKDA